MEIVTVLPSPQPDEKVGDYIDRSLNSHGLPDYALELLRGYAATITLPLIAGKSISVEGDKARISEIFKPESLVSWEGIGDSVWESMLSLNPQEKLTASSPGLPNETELIEAFCQIELQPEAAKDLIAQLNSTNNALDQIKTQIKTDANPLIQKEVSSQYTFRRRPLLWLARRALGTTTEQEAQHIAETTSEIIKEITAPEASIQKAIEDICRRDLRKNALISEARELSSLLLEELARLGFNPTVISIAINLAINNYYFPVDDENTN